MLRSMRQGHMPTHDSLVALFNTLDIDPATLQPRQGLPAFDNETFEGFLRSLPPKEIAQFTGGDMEAATLVKLVLSLDPGDREKCEALMRALADARANEKMKGGKKKSG